MRPSQAIPRAKPAIFMLKVKCDPIARETGIARGKVVVRLDQGTGGPEKCVSRCVWC